MSSTHTDVNKLPRLLVSRCGTPSLFTGVTSWECEAGSTPGSGSISTGSSRLRKSDWLLTPHCSLLCSKAMASVGRSYCVQGRLWKVTNTEGDQGDREKAHVKEIGIESFTQHEAGKPRWGGQCGPRNSFCSCSWLMFYCRSCLLPGFLILAGEFILVHHTASHGNVLFHSTEFHLQSNDTGKMRSETFKPVAGQQCPS